MRIVRRSTISMTLVLLMMIGAVIHAAPAELRIESVEIPAGGMVFTALSAGPRDGEPVLLLHGFPQTSHAYRRAIRMLALAGFRAVAPDQRGYSPMARPEGVEGYRIGKLIDDVVSIADALNASRFHLVGHDWGGAVAWGVAGRYPDRVLSLTVLSTPHPAALARARRTGDQNERSGYMADFAADDAEQRFLADDAAYLRSLLPSPPIKPEDRDVYLGVLGTPDALRGALNWYRALLRLPAAATKSGGGAAGSVAIRRPPLTVPTLYIWGTGDTVFSPDAARATGEFVSGPYAFHALEGVGHWVMEEESDRVNALLLAHVARFSEAARCPSNGDR